MVKGGKPLFAIHHLPFTIHGQVMQEVRRRRAPTLIGLRARAPLILRVLASLALVGSLIYVGVAYYRGRHNRPFRLIPGKAELSTTVERRIENYERRVTEGNRLTMLVRGPAAQAGQAVG